MLDYLFWISFFVGLLVFGRCWFSKDEDHFWGRGVYWISEDYLPKKRSCNKE